MKMTDPGMGVKGGAMTAGNAGNARNHATRADSRCRVISGGQKKRTASPDAPAPREV